MNKKFSTLVATLLLSGALFTLNAAPTSLAEFDALAGVELAADGNSLKLTDNVVFTDQKNYLLIDKNGFILDGNGKELTAHIVITGKNVTVKNLTINYKNVFAEGEDGTIAVNKTAITVIADGVTLDGNTINGSTDHFLVNGITVFPTGNKGKIVVKNNTIKKANGVVGDTFSSGFQIAGDYTLSGTGCSSVTGTDKTVADLSTLQLTVSGNKYEECTTDLSYTTGWSETELSKQGVVIASQVTPIVDKNTNKITNANAIKVAVEKAVEGASIVFNGTAEQLAEALKDLEEVEPVAIETKDGAVVSGAKQLDKTVNGFTLVENPKSDYYLFVVKGDDGKSYAISADETGKPTCYTGTEAWSTLAEKEDYLWTMTQTKDADGEYTFVFKNKAGVTLKVNDQLFVQSVAKTPYNKNGVAFNLNGINLDDKDATAHYFGLYRLSSHNVPATDLNNLQNGAFYVSFSGVEGTDAFAGLLTAVPNSSTIEFKLKNADGKYIKADAKNVQGQNVNQYVYAFELTSDADKANNFKFFHTPSAAIEDHLMIDKIDSIQVQVPTATANVKGWATLGTYKLTTEGTKTLGASIETELDAVSISLNNNVVEPTKFLKKGYAVIKQLNKEGAEDDLLVVATGCGDNKITLAESVANGLEKQWAISYDVEKKAYKMVNRENTDAMVEDIAWTELRENPEDGEDYEEDNIYVYEGEKYEITFVPVDESSDYYKYLSSTADELKDLTFVMSYWSTVFDGYANVSINKDGVAVIGTNAAQAEFKAEAADSVMAKTTVSYFEGGKWNHPEYTLKAPIYKFTAISDDDDSFGLQGGKYGINAEDADPIVIRMADEHFNLITVDEKALEGKIYAGNNDSYMYKANCMYDENKNTMFLVDEKGRPEYRRFGKTIEDGFNDIEGDLNKLKFFRTNDENTFLYENSANKNANNGNGIAKDSLNFLGETNLADKSASAQLPFLVDTAYIRNNTRKPLYMLAVRAGEWEKSIKVVAPCGDPDGPHYDADNKETNDPWKCQHATKKEVWSRTGEYLVTLADSAYVNGISGEIYNSQALYQGNVRLAFVPATHFENDTLVIESSRFRGTKEAANDTLCFVDKNGKQQMNEATFAFRLVDPTTVDDNKAEFYIEAMPNDKGEAQYVRIHNSVPVLVTDLDQAAVFDVQGAEEGEDATANEGIETASVKVIAGNGIVTVKGAAGKNVVITNVLGQTVANTVVASDEATIAAPAGVVIVAVEGEDAVKAIVK
ncbi:DUF6383 domain-containing protein [Parabacteroides sp. W1-Q-101]|uniref:DUF6383 domain-containing protein n=1 Tax=Parabacteroides TaxID=375288 RepID=UPI0020309DAD|nr:MULTISPECIES: DUF6383 domain-containing protein [Parabacteroides]MCM0719296.1 DUF6383 domain-containing protein [Parabacteroides sp. W1-Q-101]